MSVENEHSGWRPMGTLDIAGCQIAVVRILAAKFFVQSSMAWDQAWQLLSLPMAAHVTDGQGEGGLRSLKLRHSNHWRRHCALGE